MSTYISRPGDRQSFNGGAGMNTSDSRNRCVKFDGSGNLVRTTDADDVMIGVVVTPATNAEAGSEIGIITGGMVQVVTGSADAVAVGGSLSTAADGKVVAKAAQAIGDRLIALEASSAEDTTILAYFVG